MDHILHDIAVCAFLVGVLPVLFARGSRARLTAVVFGCISVGLGIYFFLTDTSGTGPVEWRRVGLLVAAALSFAYVSLLMTFRLDKKSETKS